MQCCGEKRASGSGGAGSGHGPNAAWLYAELGYSFLVCTDPDVPSFKLLSLRPALQDSVNIPPVKHFEGL